MKEFVEKLIERLEEEKSDWNYDYNVPINKAIQIVKDLASEHNNGWIEKILEAKKNCGEDSDCSECPFGQIEDRCILQELQFEKDNGWISVEDELPPRNESVLCWAVSLARGGDCCCLGSCDNGFWFMQTQIDTYSFPQQYEVVAWHKLPAPYKKGE